MTAARDERDHAVDRDLLDRRRVVLDAVDRVGRARAGRGRRARAAGRGGTARRGSRAPASRRCRSRAGVGERQRAGTRARSARRATATTSEQASASSPGRRAGRTPRAAPGSGCVPSTLSTAIFSGSGASSASGVASRPSTKRHADVRPVGPRLQRAAAGRARSPAGECVRPVAGIRGPMVAVPALLGVVTGSRPSPSCALAASASTTAASAPPTPAAARRRQTPRGHAEQRRRHDAPSARPGRRATARATDAATAHQPRPPGRHADPHELVPRRGPRPRCSTRAAPSEPAADFEVPPVERPAVRRRPARLASAPLERRARRSAGRASPRASWRDSRARGSGSRRAPARRQGARPWSIRPRRRASGWRR